MPYFPNSISLRRLRDEDPELFQLSIEGAFYSLKYSRRRVLIAEVTRMNGSGELSPLLPELLWNLRGVGPSVFARFDVLIDDDETPSVIRRIRTRKEDVIAARPKRSRGWLDLQASIGSIDTFYDILSDPNSATAYFHVFYVTHASRESLLRELAGLQPNARPKYLASATECIVTDESDGERNRFIVYGPRRNESPVIGVIEQTCLDSNVSILHEPQPGGL